VRSLPRHCALATRLLVSWRARPCGGLERSGDPSRPAWRVKRRGRTPSRRWHPGKTQGSMSPRGFCGSGGPDEQKHHSCIVASMVSRRAGWSCSQLACGTGTTPMAHGFGSDQENPHQPQRGSDLDQALACGDARGSGLRRGCGGGHAGGSDVGGCWRGGKAGLSHRARHACQRTTSVMMIWACHLRSPNLLWSAGLGARCLGHPSVGGGFFRLTGYAR